MPEAGTKFKTYDLVTINKDKYDWRRYLSYNASKDEIKKLENQIFIVKDIPKKDNSEIYLKNGYVVCNIEEDENGILRQEYFPEYHLQKYTGNIPKNISLQKIKNLVAKTIKYEEEIEDLPF